MKIRFYREPTKYTFTAYCNGVMVGIIERHDPNEGVFGRYNGRYKASSVGIPSFIGSLSNCTDYLQFEVPKKFGGIPPSPTEQPTELGRELILTGDGD